MPLTARAISAPLCLSAPWVISVTAASPIADFAASPISGTVPLTVTFTDQSSGGPNSWDWSFGDDDTSTEQNPTHTFTEVRDYTVVLMVTDADGDFDIAVLSITVGAPPNQGRMNRAIIGWTWKSSHAPMKIVAA